MLMSFDIVDAIEKKNTLISYINEWFVCYASWVWQDKFSEV